MAMTSENTLYNKTRLEIRLAYADLMNGRVFTREEIDNDWRVIAAATVFSIEDAQRRLFGIDVDECSAVSYLAESLAMVPDKNRYEVARAFMDFAKSNPVGVADLAFDYCAEDPLNRPHRNLGIAMGGLPRRNGSINDYITTRQDQ